jgi:uncharacterized protein YqgV (UPF0045/DUF77 family)
MMSLLKKLLQKTSTDFKTVGVPLGTILKAKLQTMMSLLKKLQQKSIQISKKLLI